MHELSVCQALMQQVEALAQQHGANRVSVIRLGIGPLSGIESKLLQHAYPLASAGTVAEGADLLIESTGVTVRCLSCGETSEVKPNHLVCEHCGDWRTELVSGDELVLITVELSRSKHAEQETLH